MSVPLTQGSIMRAYNNDTTGKPYVQVIDIKKIGTANPERYRVILSDGQHYQQAMLATQLNSKILSGELTNYCIIQMNEFLCNLVSNRKILILLNLNVVDSGPGHSIGNPQSCDPKAGGAAAPDTGAGGRGVGGGGGGGGGSSSSSGRGSGGSGGAFGGGRGYQQQQQQQQQARSWNNDNKFGPGGRGGGGGGFGGGGFGGGRGGGQLAGQKRPYGGANLGPASKRVTAFHPIASLNPYHQKWTIKARVTAKSTKRNWSNQRGGGVLFSVDLLDAQGGEIRATMFGDAAEKFFPILQENKVYTISRGQLKQANKRFTHIQNDYELTLNSDAEIEIVDGDDDSIQTQVYNFPAAISMIKDLAPDDYVDVIGVVKSYTGVGEVVSKKTGKPLTKRSISLMDQYLNEVDLTLWGEQADKYNEQILGGNPVMVVKSARVGAFGGRSLSTTFGSQISINPDIKEAHNLRSWWESKGKDARETKSISNERGGGSPDDPRKTLSQIKDEKLATANKDGKAFYFVARATVTFVKTDPAKPPWYLACPECNKKATDDGHGTFTCVSNHMTHQPIPRYILNMLICDHSGSTWITAFNEQANRIVGMSAPDVQKLKEEQGETAFTNVFAQANFKTFSFKLRVKLENAMDAMSERCHVVTVDPIKYVEECHYLLSEIAKYD